MVRTGRGSCYRSVAAAAAWAMRLATASGCGCAAWGDQARRELRASGETSCRRDLHPRDQLTAQEPQIAQLAAQGLSNRDIAQRLYLSHRTIGTHLYRIFPKLGITSRGELSSALSATSRRSALGAPQQTRWSIGAVITAPMFHRGG